MIEGWVCGRVAPWLGGYSGSSRRGETQIRRTVQAMSDQTLRGLDVLLIQVRDVEAVALHERHSVLDQSGLTEDQLDAVNVVTEPYIDWRRIEAADAIILGGAGGHSATRHEPWTDQLLDHVKRAIDAGKPMIGMCFGQHLIAKALGGEVVTDPEAREIGVHEIELTPKGNDDPIFRDCPKRFHVLLAHNDRVRTLPDGCHALAHSSNCPNQVFAVADKPIYGTLFHIELTPKTLLDRLQRYRAEYIPDQAEFEQMVASLRPTPHAESILNRFLHRCVTHASA